jgi:iron complex outermembrane recepter protein
MRRRHARSEMFTRVISRALCLALMAMISPTAFGQSQEPPLTPAQNDNGTVTDVVTVTADPMRAIATGPSESAFGLSKSLLETPRSVSAISNELLDQYAVKNIEDLATMVPNSYTTSAFGIAGSLDLRGTSSENYFRGMKRIENGGVFPTPIGATDRVEIVRGPPSPIYGPGKIGGYLNFVPKSARADTGKYLDEPTTSATLTYGSYDKRELTFERGGAIDRDGGDNKKIGYYVYTQYENSGSWYRNAHTDQLLVQSSFDMDMGERWRLEFGQQYQQWKSIELSGINRLTQEYIDNGTYVSGKPLVDLDANKDGVLSVAELQSKGPINITIPYGTAPQNIHLPASFELDPATVQYVHLPDNLIFADDGDYADATASLFYLDVINDSNPNLTITNKTMIDTIERKKDTTQGFATSAEGFQIENKTVVQQIVNPAKWLHMTNVGAFSYRYFDGTNRSFNNTQPFDRRDLYVGAQPSDRIVSSLDDPIAAPWNANRDSTHATLGLGVLSDMRFLQRERLDLVVGGRVDYIAIEASADPASTLDGPPTSPAKTTGVHNRETATSYSVSLSYAVTPGIIPYLTNSKQSSLQIGNIGDVPPANVASPLTDSTLDEAGLKVSLISGKLYSSVAWYRQTRAQIDPNTFESFSTEGEGYELELRFVPTRRISITGASAWQKTKYLTAPTSFTVPPEFFGLSGIDGWGGTLRVSGLPASLGFDERGGVPHNAYSLFGTYSVPMGLKATLGFVRTDAMYSGSAKTFLLPAATVGYASVFYDARKWRVGLQVNNLTNERYFQAISPDNIGNTVALPKPPRTYEVNYGYNF